MLLYTCLCPASLFDRPRLWQNSLLDLLTASLILSHTSNVGSNKSVSGVP